MPRVSTELTEIDHVMNACISARHVRVSEHYFIDICELWSSEPP